MATVRIPDEKRSLQDAEEIRTLLVRIGITYERWPVQAEAAAGATADEILEAYAEPIHRLKAEEGYLTADVIDVHPGTAGLEVMLAKFNTEHWHDEDEVRFIVAGRGLFHIHPTHGPVIAIEVEAGDLIRVPRGTRHWFNLCGEKRIRACFGPRFIPPQTVAK